MADDQRYCLECGERRMPMSSVLFGGTTAAASTGEGPSPATVPPSPPGAAPPGPTPSGGAPQHNPTLTVLAGVGVLLLAMGVGVLIGRAGSPKQAAAPTQAITVEPGGSSGTATGGSSEATFTSSWPTGTSGYTVQLQTLPASSAVSAVEAAKTSASAKGAKAVGALKSEEFSSLPSGSYVIYAGVYTTRRQAEKALPGLRKSFPGAKVVKVASSGASGSKESEPSSSSSSSSSSPGGTGNNGGKPASPSVLNGLKGAKGKSYEEKSKSLPDVVETG